MDGEDGDWGSDFFWGVEGVGEALGDGDEVGERV